MKEDKKPEDGKQRKLTRKKIEPTKKNPKGAGRKKTSLDEPVFTGWDQLNQLALWGSQEFCAEQLGVSISTLQRLIKEKFGINFDQYRNKRREVIKINLAKKQYDIAMGGNTAMLIWLGKQYMGQSDKIEKKQENSFVDENGNSIITVEFVGTENKEEN